MFCLYRFRESRRGCGAGGWFGVGHRRRGAGDGGVAGGRRDGAGVLVAQDRAGETASGGNGW